MAPEGTGAERRTEGLDAGRFEVLVRELAPSLYRFALSLVRDPHAAEDLVQETFVRAFEQRSRFRGESSEATWLRRILHNLAVDRARRSGREILVEEVEEKWRNDAYTVDSAVVVDRAEAREDLEDGLVRLPFIYRSAIVLHEWEGGPCVRWPRRWGSTWPRPSMSGLRDPRHRDPTEVGGATRARGRHAKRSMSSPRREGSHALVAWSFAAVEAVLLVAIVAAPRGDHWARARRIDAVAAALALTVALGPWPARRFGRRLTRSPLPDGAVAPMEDNGAHCFLDEAVTEDGSEDGS